MMEEKKTGIQEENTTQKRDKVGIIMMLFHIIFLLASIILILRVIQIQFFYEPHSDYVRYLVPNDRLHKTEPVRGSIMAKDGRLLASSMPMYQIYMDCTVQKEAFRSDKDSTKKEKAWLEKASRLSDGLSKIYGDRSKSEYYRYISHGRVNGRQYAKIGYPVDHETLQELKKLPLFNESSYKGGMIVERTDTRQYPYGALARRTIGSVRNNHDKNSHIGIEGKYDYILHGKEGREWQRKTDAKGWIPNYDSVSVKVENGLDIRTTIDIDMQDIVDKALRQRIKENENIEGGCAIVMETGTGAIRAMVNLKNDDKGEPREIYNYAIGRSGDPGSVFKLATVMTLLEDGKIKSLEEKVPTYKGKWEYQAGKKTRVFRDEYLEKWPESTISIIDAFKISSNNAFRLLACRHYEDNPKHFTDKLYEYKLTETFDFDLTGLATPQLATPDKPNWSGTALPSIAIGYTVNVTPLHILTFYNAVANKGKMMKPYLVEAFEENGHCVKRISPVILNAAICSRATIDTLTRALRAVTAEGTGRGLKDAKCEVAGKTGTAQIPFEIEKNGRKRVVYVDDDGNREHQATFVGFFPADAPEYTTIVVLYKKRGKGNLYGSFAIPAFRTIVDEVYSLSEEWGDEIECRGSMPQMEGGSNALIDDKAELIPAVTGMGLKDAVFTIENNGFRCVFEGVGHVASQSPKAGSKAKKGDTVKIILK